LAVISEDYDYGGKLPPKEIETEKDIMLSLLIFVEYFKDQNPKPSLAVLDEDLSGTPRQGTFLLIVKL